MQYSLGIKRTSDGLIKDLRSTVPFPHINVGDMIHYNTFPDETPGPDYVVTGVVHMFSSSDDHRDPRHHVTAMDRIITVDRKR
jgi:hypothetical protein